MSFGARASWLVALAGVACSREPSPRPLTPRPLVTAGATLPPSTSTSAGASATRAHLASDTLEPALFTAGVSNTWDDAPGRAPAYCARGGLGTERDTSCSAERGLAELADALALPAAPPEAAQCSSAWSDELRAARARPSREDLQRRDRALSKLESCAGLEGELVRLARAMLWPDCADSLAVNTPSANISVALRGYALAAKLSRLVFAPPNTPVPHAAPQGPDVPLATAKAWIESQAAVLRRANQALSTLPAASHGRAAAELALGRAWSRLLHSRLDLPPLPPAERAAAREPLQRMLAPYVAEAEPLMARAAFAATVVSEWPLLRALQPSQLSGVAEAARALVLPPLPARAAPAGETELRLAAGLPSYVAVRFVRPERATGPTLRALLQQGFDPALRRALASRQLSAEDRLLVAHGRTVLAARSLVSEQAALAANLVRDLPDDHAAALSSIASALATSLTRPTTEPSAGVTSSSPPTSPHFALLSYDSWRLALAEPGSTAHALEARARELAAPFPALTACFPSGFIQERGCACPSIQTLY